MTPVTPSLSLVYPKYRHLIQNSITLSLAARSLVIKCCQAQQWPIVNDGSALSHMLLDHGPIILRRDKNMYYEIQLIDYGSHFDLEFDAITSAIILDIMRALPLPDHEIQTARTTSWVKEIALSEGKRRPSACFWNDIFDLNAPDDIIVHKDLPVINPQNIRNLRRHLTIFRNKYQEKTLYRRATHKNMSWSTRREFEEHSGQSLEGVGVFGQDDWQRYYHTTGHTLGGVCEMRQKWYPSGAKPRTYFAQGGITYNRSGFLQDFFTDLANAFTPTNHIDRLRPERLVGSTIDRSDPRFYIYDLSNFTSNMSEQRGFCYALAEFFSEVLVEILDERVGFTTANLGELLYDYTVTCVDGPELSYERWDPELGHDHTVEHGIASLLGIFGNLMTCTVAHFFIMSPITQSWQEINIAGDDGIVAEDGLDNLLTQTAISIVGAHSVKKCFHGFDVCAICLKRPFIQTFPTCYLLNLVIPPTLITILTYCLGENVDTRYTFIGVEDLSREKRIGTIGKDLLRFLTSAFNAQVPVEDVAPVFKGYAALVRKHFRDFRTDIPSVRPLWPKDPSSYVFSGASPIMALCQHADLTSRPIPILGNIRDFRGNQAFQNVGDVLECNRSQRLKLLCRLGYIEECEITRVELDPYKLYLFWYRTLTKVPAPPKMFEYVVFKPIPDSFL
jgi:hypothetical protein